MNIIQVLSERFLRWLGMGVYQRECRRLKSAYKAQEQKRIGLINEVLRDIRQGKDAEKNIGLLYWLLIIGELRSGNDLLLSRSHFWSAVQSPEYSCEWRPILSKILIMHDGSDRRDLVNKLAAIMDKLVEDIDADRLCAELGVDPEPSEAFVFDYEIGSPTLPMAAE